MNILIAFSGIVLKIIEPEIKNLKSDIFDNSCTKVLKAKTYQVFHYKDSLTLM